MKPVLFGGVPWGGAARLAAEVLLLLRLLLLCADGAREEPRRDKGRFLSVGGPEVAVFPLFKAALKVFIAPGLCLCTASCWAKDILLLL